MEDADTSARVRAAAGSLGDAEFLGLPDLDWSTGGAYRRTLADRRRQQ